MNIAVIGSTGIIGKKTLEIVKKNPQKYRVISLACDKNVDLFLQQIKQFKPIIASVQNEQSYMALRPHVGKETTLLCGLEGLKGSVSHESLELIVLSASGIAALPYAVEAVKNAKNIALANKESIVCAGNILLNLAAKNNVKIIPVDSEHSAIFQCLEGREMNHVESIILTASGGPFFGKTREQLKCVTPAEALKHPVWSMGNKITIDSATMANKALEIIEAHYLFCKPVEYIIHPQSVVHSMVKMCDGNVLALLGHPDMDFPIRYALDYPQRTPVPCDLSFLSKPLSFFEPDESVFVFPKIARRALQKGGTATTVFNCANEQAVQLFVQGKIGFLQIAEIVGDMVERVEHIAQPSLEDIYYINQICNEYIKGVY